MGTWFTAEQAYQEQAIREHANEFVRILRERQTKTTRAKLVLRGNGSTWPPGSTQTLTGRLGSPGIDVAVDARKPTSYGPIPRIDCRIDDPVRGVAPRTSAS